MQSRLIRKGRGETDTNISSASDFDYDTLGKSIANAGGRGLGTRKLF